MSEEVLKALANEQNQAILNLLAVEPTYPRKIGDLLALSETEVARRLRQMERLGLVKGEWARIGKNVKLYKLVAGRIVVDIGASGLRVQVGDRGLTAQAQEVRPFAAPIPEVEGFEGREAELAVLRGPEPVVLVEGMPGIGKSVLLAQYARSLGEGAVFWHAFRGVESLNWLANRLGLFLAPLGRRELLDAVERGAEPADKRELMLQGLDTPGVVAVLDDVHRVEDEAVREFLADATARVRRAKLVLAGRERPPHRVQQGQVRVLTLAGLSDEAVRAIAAAKGFPLDAALLPRLREEVGGHPLALLLFLEAARSLGVQPEALLDRVPERELEEWLLREIHGTLSEDERHLLALASLFRGTFREEDLAALSTRRLQGALLRLRKRLLVQAAPEGYALHEVVRNFSYQLLHDKPQLHARLAEHYLAKGTLEARLEAMHHFLAAGQRHRVLDLLHENLDLREFDLIDAGYQDLYLRTLELFDRAEVKGDRVWGLILDEKGDIRLHRGQATEALALYAQAEAIFRAAQDKARLADLGWKRGLALRSVGRHREALQACEAGLVHAAEGSLARERLEELRGELARGAAAAR